MKKIFTKQYMQENCGCYADTKGKLESCSFMQNEEITIDNIVNSEIPLKDKYWFVIRKTELTKEQKQQIAIKVAEIVLPIYEKRYPENKAPREAIEAAKQYLAGHISLNVLLEKRSAANAAYAAYAAAYAAYAAADAADYAAYAAYAAANATYAAYAAYAAADAADAADYAAYAAYAAANATYAANAANAAYAAANAADAAYAADANAAEIKQQLQDYLTEIVNNF